MLSLDTPVICDKDLAPFLLKLASRSECSSFQDAVHFPEEISFDFLGHAHCRIGDKNVVVQCPQNDSILGDVVLISPSGQRAQRLIRRNSNHNTILFTERCDQLCAMCSQPPKDKDYLSLVPYYADAIILADSETQIGISGGEPTLHMQELLWLLERVATARSDISVHILTNAQHFSADDRDRLSDLNEKLKILWGIPLYASDPSLHDVIVGKVGAFEPLINNLYFLASIGARIELRTVLTAKNVMELPELSKFISTNLPFIDYWAVMAMEPIGYAKANRSELFFDHSLFIEPLLAAIDYSVSTGTPLSLYNFPLCTIPSRYRRYCSQSISDWKRKYLGVCEGCAGKELCTGFFEWYSDKWEWNYVHKLSGEEL